MSAEAFRLINERLAKINLMEGIHPLR